MIGGGAQAIRKNGESEGPLLSESVRRALGKYRLLDRPNAVVAFSGGKDSISLAVSLRELGKTVRLRAIDMGYSPDWAERIRTLAGHLGFPLDLITVRDLIEGDALSSEVRSELQARREFLDELAIAPRGMSTPCTNCYNCKILSLVNGGGGLGDDVVYFGHHGTDMLASFIKSALMYYDRWELGFEKFDRIRFRRHCAHAARDLVEPASQMLSLFVNYLVAGFANTSEPPVQRGRMHGRDYMILRPMVLSPEARTVSFAAKLGVKAESSGCGHTALEATRTPREIVHYELLPSVASSQRGSHNLRQLTEAILANLTASGELSNDSRQRRHELLGVNYKGGPAELANRL